MGQTRRRVSYIIPPPTTYVPCLQLPPHGLQRLGVVTPLLTPYKDQATPHVDETPAWARHPRHRLGVAALALDTSTCLTGRGSPEGILYSGGRDGLVIGWDLGISMKKRKSIPENPTRRNHWEVITGWADDSIEEEEDGEERIGSDGDVLGEVVSKRQRRRRSGEIPHEQQWETDFTAFQPGKHSEFRQCAQAHADWINDILLCNYNQTLLTASSDGTVKAWSPHSATPSDPSIIGSHTDYVRCLSLCRDQNWVASGSFDRTIKLWDLSRSASSSASVDPLITLNPSDATAPKSSVYALTVDPIGGLIASGSPERVIRLWDPRTGKRTGKLVGHTDNIRAILISEDARYLLTGSADASIKLWSLSSQRCLHTFTHHTDSVWSLYSSHPYLETFYSGDRSGLVCRIDVEGCGDLTDGECALLCSDPGDPNRPSTEGINRIMVMDDNLLWTASGSSTIKRWQIPQTMASKCYSIPQDPELPFFKRRLLPDPNAPSRPTAEYGMSRRLPDLPQAGSRPSTGHSLPRRMSSVPSLIPDQIPRRISSVPSLLPDAKKERRQSKIPLDSRIPLLSPDAQFSTFAHNRNRDPEVSTLYSAASVMSVPRSAARTVGGQSPRNPFHNSRTEDTIIPAEVAMANYEDRELASEATPYCKEPDDLLSGEDGLVRSIILNDRVHALTVDTSGGVAVWDIVRGICIGKYLPEDVAAASHANSVVGETGEKERSPREALEVVRERIEGEGTASTWSNVDTKAGVLSVHMTERCFDAEVYADEVGFTDDSHYSEDTKLNLGKWVLRNLFLGFIKEEIQIQANGNDSPVHAREGALPPSITRGDNNHSLDSPRKTHQRSPSSPESLRKKHRRKSSAIIFSPKMIPAVAPGVINPVHASPLIAPMIPLHPVKEGLTPIASLPTPAEVPPSSYHQRSRSATMDNAQIARTPSATGASGGDYFTVRAKPTPIGNDDLPMTPNTPSGLMGRLKNLGKSSKRPTSDASSPILRPVTPTADNLATTEDLVLEPKPKTPMQQLLAGPLTPPSSSDAPTHAFPGNTVILISEEATPSYRTVYRGNVAGLSSDLAALEEEMPMWLAEYLLIGKVPHSVPLAKLSFILLPWNKDPEMEPLPELLNTAQSKLTASRYLRVAKILQHVQDKIDKINLSSKPVSVRSSVDGDHTTPARDIPKPPRPKAEDVYEILCNETLLPSTMTLAAVRQYVWRQSGELVMHYRRIKIPKFSSEFGPVGTVLH